MSARPSRTARLVQPNPVVLAVDMPVASATVALENWTTPVKLNGIQKVRGSNPLGSTTTCGGHRFFCVRFLVVVCNPPVGLTAVLTATRL